MPTYDIIRKKSLPEVPQGTKIRLLVRLSDAGAVVAWTSLSAIEAYIYSEDQRLVTGRCSASVCGDDPTLLVAEYGADQLQYLGVNKLLVRAKYMGATRVYEREAYATVTAAGPARTAEVAVSDGEDIEVGLSLQLRSTSLLDDAIAAALNAALEVADRIEQAEEAGIAGPQGESAYDIAVRHGYEGTEEEWVESHESLPGRVAVLEMNGSQFTLTATPQVIFKDSGTQVAVAAHASGPAAAGIDEIGLYMNGAKVSSVEESDTLTYSTQLLDTTALRADFSHAGIVKQVSAQVTAVGHIYYGSGSDAADFDTHKTAYPNPVTSPARTYNVAVRNDGDHVFFKVPSTMNIARVTLGGFDFPVTLVSTEGGKLYMSDNTYLAGTLTLVVS